MDKPMPKMIRYGVRMLLGAGTMPSQVAGLLTATDVLAKNQCGLRNMGPVRILNHGA